MVRDPSIVSPSLTGVFIGGGHNKHGTGSRCTLPVAYLLVLGGIGVRLYRAPWFFRLRQGFPLAPRLFSFPFFSAAPSLFLSIFPGKPSNFPGSEPSLRLVWAQNQPNFRPNRQNAGDFAENPCIPGNYPPCDRLEHLSTG